MKYLECRAASWKEDENATSMGRKWREVAIQNIEGYKGAHASSLGKHFLRWSEIPKCTVSKSKNSWDDFMKKASWSY